MLKLRGRTAALLLAGILVLAAGLVVGLSDAGVPLPAAVILVAIVVVLLTIVGAGIFGYRSSLREGRGIWRSIGIGFRTAGRTWFDLF